MTNLSRSIRIASLMAVLMLVGCPPPQDPTDKRTTFECYTDQLRDDSIRALPKINSALIDGNWRDMVAMLIGELGEAVVACGIGLARSQAATSAEASPQDGRSKLLLERAGKVINEKGWLYE